MATSDGAVMQKRFYEEFDLLRGLAIFLITWCHTKTLAADSAGAGWKGDWGVIDNVRSVFGDSASAYFVFISGFLFYAVFWQRGFEWKPFLKGKLMKVLCPWFLIAGIFTVWRLAKTQITVSWPDFWTGGLAFWPFWYVPFIMMLFLASGLYIKVLGMRPALQFGILVVSAVVSMMIGRHNSNPFLSAVFWNTFYLFGLLCAVYYEKLEKADIHTKSGLFMLSIFTTAMLVNGPGYCYNFSDYTEGLQFGTKIEWALPNKLLLCVLLVWAMAALRDNAGKVAGIAKTVLQWLSRYSFSIYFLQAFVVLHYIRHPMKWMRGSGLLSVEVVGFLLAVATCLFCGLLAACIKRMTGRYSRMIIGA